MRKKLLWVAVDIIAAAAVVTSIWFCNYRIPGKAIEAVPSPQLSEHVAPSDAMGARTSGLPQTNIKTSKKDWRKRFADKFTDTIVSTDTSYTSPDLSIHLKYGSYDSNVLDTTSEGSHLSYGTNISYVLADIYVGDITCI